MEYGVWIESLFLENDAQLNGPYPDITQKEADAEAWRQRDRDKNVEEYDEMHEFQNAADRGFAAVVDPVKFWIENKYRWPHVSFMALEIYGIPASEAVNERLYSQTGDMVTERRGRLKADTIGVAQCLRQWDTERIIDYR
jgi:hypothetical protein